MDRIVQLSEREYNELYEKAAFNEEQINREAIKRYEENGFAEIRVDVRTEYDSMYSGLTFKASANDNKYFREGLYKPVYSDTKKLVELIDQNVKEVVKRKYGVVTEGSKTFEKELMHNRKVQKTFKYLTITGWLLSIIFFSLLWFK